MCYSLKINYVLFADVPEAADLRNARLQQYIANISSRIEPFHMQLRSARDEIDGNYTLAIV